MKITIENIRTIILEEIKNTIEEHEFSEDFVGPTEEIYLFFNSSKDKRFFEKNLGQYTPYDPINRHCGDDSGTVDKDIVYLSVKFSDKGDSFNNAIKFFNSQGSEQIMKQEKGQKISSRHDRSVTQQKADYLKEIDNLHVNAKNFINKLNAFITIKLREKRKKNERFKPYGMLIKAKCGEVVGDFIKYNNIRVKNYSRR
tara:strand:- start:370 stop:966 length:597 start_codon:yes stop_codon:yes gene_type:complete